MRGSLAPLVLVLSIGVQDTQGQQPETAVLPEPVHPWPMYGHDARHSGRTALVGPQTSDVAWRQVTGFSPYNVGVASVPAVAADGTIYIAILGDKLLAMAPEGTFKWAFQAGGRIVQLSPAIADDGTVYIGSGNGTLYAINPDGTQRWTFETGGTLGNVTIGPDGTLYVGSGEFVYAIHPDGTERWRFRGCSDTGCDVGDQPVAVGPDGSVYFHANGFCIDEPPICFPSFLVAVNPDGTPRWRVWTGTGFISGFAPSVCAPSVCRGTIYLALGGLNEPDGLIAFRPNGSVKWVYETPYVSAGTSIGSDGTIYLPTVAGLHAVTPSGTRRWLAPTATTLRDRPAVGGDGTIYVNGDYEDVYAFNADGTLKWLFEATGMNPAGVAVGPDGRLYFGTGAARNSFSYLYALGEPPPGS